MQGKRRKGSRGLTMIREERLSGKLRDEEKRKERASSQVCKLV